MNARLNPRSFHQLVGGAGLAFVAVVLVGSPSRGGDDKPKKADTGYFFPVAKAKDCVYDPVKNRLYVTTPQKLVVVDTKQRKVVESVDLAGTLQGCDLSPEHRILVIAPISAQYVYRIGLDWDKIEDMEVSQIKFKAGRSETGVFSIAIGFDGSTIFSTTYAGSGGVQLRRLSAKSDMIDVVARVQMDTVICASGNRKFAAVADGNISSSPLRRYDFTTQKLKNIGDMGDFTYEIAVSKDAKSVARPNRKGCELYDDNGGRSGNLDGAPAICAAFHPKDDRLFVMRHGQINIQEYDVQGKNVSNAYPLDKPLVIQADVRVTGVVDLHPIGRDAMMAHFRTIKNVNFSTYRSGRLRVSDDGELLFAVIPTGVFMFSIPVPNPATKPKVKIKTIDP